MRILSQDGKFDIPYELAMIEVSKDSIRNKYTIYARGSFIDGNTKDNFILMAQYFKEIDAENAMEMLRNEYSKYKRKEICHEKIGYHQLFFQFP